MLRARRDFARFVGSALVLIAWAGSCKPEPPAAPKPVVVAPPPPELPAVLPFAPVPPILVRGVGFESPESVLYDPQADVYLVSNVNGGLADADGNGFISKLAPDGSLLELRWILGTRDGVVLDAPKGMALVADKLYVADINVLRSFDRKSGQPSGNVTIPSASFLNDVAAAPDGLLYVSDSGLSKIKGLADPQKNGADAIYTVDGGGVSRLLVKGTELGQPNGLLADASGVWVASLAGEVYRVNAGGQREKVTALPGNGLDGLVQTASGRLLVSSWETSSVYIAPPAPPSPQSLGAFEPLITELVAPADIGYDPKRRQLLVPLLKENAIYIQQIPASAG